jgi:signal transduction histidine kinase
VLALVGLFFMYSELTASLDKQTKVLTSEFGHAIDVSNGLPYFRDWKRVVQTNPPRGIATIQLFSPTGELLDSYGPKNVERLLTTNEIKNGEDKFRVRSTPLMRNGRSIGYLQIMVSAAQRDEAVYNFALTMAALAPLMVLGLGLTSFWVSGKAVEPLEANIENMRSFLADAGHELNTPLSIIIARAESLQRKLERKNVETSDIAVITKSANRTISLANDLMLLSELEGPLSVRGNADVDISDVISQIGQDFSERLQAKQIELEIGDIPSVYVTGNPDDLYRAFANLVENAYRYTDSGKVRISAALADGWITVRVEDTGVGIGPEHLALVFDRFYRIDKSRSRNSGGSGLGLAIVKAVIEQHGGTISLTSKVGVGTTFNIQLQARTKQASRVSGRLQNA